LHVRYNRNSFPQDLVFQATPNKENYQARYVITHPATGDFSCDAGKKYLKELKQRRQNEMETLGYLTGKGYNDWDVVVNEEEKNIPSEASYKMVAIAIPKNKSTNEILLAGIGLIGIITFVRRKRK